ncbi:MAG: hypothetical protein M0Z76_03535 [Gammaproteobacteria bacterium]|nr:hypothetical protein [Gammaproteobacteria bacterium]
MDWILGFFFGIVGSAYFVYGRKQQHAMALVSGVALMVYSMLVSGTLWLVVLGLGFMALPFVISF